MAIYLTRANYQENISGEVNSYDDAVDFHFAYNGESGVLAGAYEEMNYETPSTSVFRVLSGKAVIYGRQFEILEGTYEDIPLTVPPAGQNYYYNIYAKLDLTDNTNQKVTVEAQPYGTAGFPSWPVNQDLIRTPIGTAYLPLYRFILTSNGISNITSVRLILSATRLWDALFAERQARNDAIENINNRLDEELLASGTIPANSPITDPITITITLPAGVSIDKNNDYLKIEFESGTYQWKGEGYAKKPIPAASTRILFAAASNDIYFLYAAVVVVDAKTINIDKYPVYKNWVKSTTADYSYKIYRIKK